MGAGAIPSHPRARAEEPVRRDVVPGLRASGLALGRTPDRGRGTCRRAALPPTLVPLADPGACLEGARHVEPPAGPAQEVTEPPDDGRRASGATSVRLAAVCLLLLGLALVQDPGFLVADTKFDLVL